MKKIFFTPTFPVEKSLYPEPASKNIPEWYKKTESYINSNNIKILAGGAPNLTIKKCIPVFDAISAGYIIKTYTDIYVQRSPDGQSHYSWPSYNPISFHPIDQAPNHPNNNDMPYPKWNSPWSIETPIGYSCLFISPMHNPNNIFTILPGIVDTDTYKNPVNFPFTLNNKDFEGIIPAGTPMVQVIPFKRDVFVSSIGDMKKVNEISMFQAIYNNKFVNNYKSKFWKRKEYK
jgi:hypothetical protein